MNDILNFLSEKWIGNIIAIVGVLVALVGGLLGLLTFINSYLLAFKPRMFLGSKAFVLAKKEPHLLGKGVILNSIVCSLEIGNHRNKYGSILDFAVRVYQADALNPDQAVYFVSTLWSKFPFSIQDTINCDKSLFSPLNILPKSERSLHIEFSELLNRSNMIIDSDANLYLELYYQISPKHDWTFLRTYYMYAKDVDKLNSNLMIKYTIIESHITRDRISKTLISPKSSLYKGTSQKYIKLTLSRLSYRLFVRPVYWVRDLALSIPYFFLNAFVWVYDLLIRLPLIKKTAKTIQEVRETFGQPDMVPKTQSSFEKIFEILSKEVSKINSQADDEAKIHLDKEDKNIVLSRYKMSLEFYIAGDGHIIAQDSTGLQNPRLRFRLSLKRTSLGYYIWHLENQGYVSVKSFTLRVLDAFILHSNY